MIVTPPDKVYGARLRISALLALACVLLALAGCGYTGATTSVSRDVIETLEFGGLTRSYILHRPPSTGAPPPLLLAFHGGGDTAADMERLTHFDELADKEGFLVVYPQGVANRWADAPASAAPDATSVDDIGFVRALLDDLKRLIAYDPARVYATGVSIGGFFTARLGCEAADRIAAIGVVAATLAAPEAERCAPARHVSVVTMHGTDDTVIPAAGGEMTTGDGGYILSVADTARTWTRVDGCAAQPDVTYEPDSADDGTRVRRETYPGCADGAAVVFYIIEGGGHTWPGGPSYVSGTVINRSTHDIDGSAVLWSFFQAHSLNGSL
jgi:polyhydroxybutyrate depolymerase